MVVDAESSPPPESATLVTLPPAPPPPPTDWANRPMALSPRVRIVPLRPAVTRPPFPPRPPVPESAAEAPKLKVALALSSLLTGVALAVTAPPWPPPPPTDCSNTPWEVAPRVRYVPSANSDTAPAVPPTPPSPPMAKEAARLPPAVVAFTAPPAPPPPPTDCRNTAMALSPLVSTVSCAGEPLLPRLTLPLLAP